MSGLPGDETSGDLGWFDRFAGAVATWVARAPFFAACVALVVIWAPTLLFLDLDTSQLLINTATTIVTFLLVALLQNTTARADKASQAKQNALADALSDLFEAMAAHLDMPGLLDDARELREAVGLEDRVSS